MDALYFNTKNREALFEELELPYDYTGGIYESQANWAIVWLGKLPAQNQINLDDQGFEYELVTEWQEGEFFNVYLRGQDNMDYFTQRLNNATLLNEPVSPNMELL